MKSCYVLKINSIWTQFLIYPKMIMDLYKINTLCIDAQIGF